MCVCVCVCVWGALTRRERLDPRGKELRVSHDVPVDAIGCLPAVIKVYILVSGGLVTSGDLRARPDGSDRGLGSVRQKVRPTPCAPGRIQRRRVQDKHSARIKKKKKRGKRIGKRFTTGSSVARWRLCTIRSAVRLMRFSLKQSSSSPVQLRLHRYLRRRTHAQGCIRVLSFARGLWEATCMVVAVS